MTRKDEVLEVVREQGRTRRGDVSKKLGIDEDYAGTLLSELAAENPPRLLRHKKGVYDLPENVDDPYTSGSDKATKEKGEAESVEVPLVSIRANAGEGAEPFQEQVERYVTFDRDAIKREANADPGDLTMIAVTGDSMQPTLNPGDRVLVVRHKDGEPLISGSIYIWRSNLRGIIVKRLRWKDDQTVVLESDNDRGPTIEVDMKNDDGHGWEVLGRVVRVEKHL